MKWWKPPRKHARQSLSWCVCRQKSLHLSQSLDQCSLIQCQNGAQPHIVSGNKAGNKHFLKKTSRFSAEVKWAAPGSSTSVTSVSHSLDALLSLWKRHETSRTHFILLPLLHMIILGLYNYHSKPSWKIWNLSISLHPQRFSQCSAWHQKWLEMCLSTIHLLLNGSSVFLHLFLYFTKCQLINSNSILDEEL